MKRREINLRFRVPRNRIYIQIGLERASPRKINPLERKNIPEVSDIRQDRSNIKPEIKIHRWNEGVADVFIAYRKKCYLDPRRWRRWRVGNNEHRQPLYESRASLPTLVDIAGRQGFEWLLSDSQERRKRNMICPNDHPFAQPRLGIRDE